ncbi:hypothetical protein TBLA_0H03590 [Henningerozyma blattae CBS 6284]|uniref:Bud emergence protein 1 n=1 Tax=Henningerozyma blattae (strain ATCC 34711 / CBS 6284 / DSM 70876 / NBRC 10599 / NRRL Y-10934 / UCD 77-7) TaxID=1071380 RepID=I2H8D9_HENB6|nr:hypothetical protein TBLA_0H03590 [Tetrapisispora blattae CBS 6284]CCH62641.1 hypothetical protein TBLA_0H03590 [Tetrapisispora blattae CBS 6284]
MLKGLKIARHDSQGSRSRITSADISSPTQDMSNVIKHVKTVPIRQASASFGSGSNLNTTASMTTRSSRSSRDIMSPEKVIKAIRSYDSNNSSELSFLKGEFFYVIEEDSTYYGATNPSTGKTGKVRKSFFESFNRTRPGSTVSSVDTGRTTPNESIKSGNMYAIVLYDFQAEKSDELTVFAGENLFICAHHNYEWFIAKPIGRLGGPGLVPVDFVSIVDISTGYATGSDVKEDILNCNLPTVQEWKMNVSKYKASNISLGSLDNPTNSFSNGSNYNNNNNSHHSMSLPNDMDGAFVIKAAVVTFALEDDKYWFTVRCQISTGKVRELKRYYQDFYDLQVKLLDTFPAEAGKLRDSNGNWIKRILPYIPGPVPYVTDSISMKRREDLDKYLKELIQLPDYISHSDMVKSLFCILDNGFDNEFDSDDHAISIEIGNRGGRSSSNAHSKGIDSMEIEDNTAIVNNNRSSNGHSSSEQDNTLTGEDLKIYEKLANISLSTSNQQPSPTHQQLQHTMPLSRPPSSLPPGLKSIKIKFYYKDDIFALLLNSNITLLDLRSKIGPRIDTKDFKLFFKKNNGDGEEIRSDTQVAELIHTKAKINVYDA